MPRYQRDPRWITLRRPGQCTACKAPLPRGARAYYFPATRTLKGATCCGAADANEASFNVAAFDEDVLASRY